jgi:hypothetical protein
VILSAKAATLHELQTVYGIKDAYDLIETIQIDAHNQRVMAPKQG